MYDNDPTTREVARDSERAAAMPTTPPQDVGSITALTNRLLDQSHQIHELLGALEAKVHPVLRSPLAVEATGRPEQVCPLGDTLGDISDRFGHAMSVIADITGRVEL